MTRNTDIVREARRRVYRAKRQRYGAAEPADVVVTLRMTRTEADALDGIVATVRENALEGVSSRGKRARIERAVSRSFVARHFLSGHLGCKEHVEASLLRDE